jgi:endonuclease YncB( thermonuclease family)
VSEARPEGTWQKLEGCRFFAGTHSDGDTVEVVQDGKNDVFRLYFIDCAELKPLSLARQAGQMKDFGIEGENAALAGAQLASAAAKFTEAQLQQPFTVYTQWEKVDPSGVNPSIRAFVETADGKDLGTLLVREGLALIRDAKKSAVDHPNGLTSGRMSAALRLAETEARVHGRGAWGLAQSAAIFSTPAPTEPIPESDRDIIFACAGKKLRVRGRVAKIAALPDGRITFVDFAGSPANGFVGIVRSDVLPIFQEKFPEGLDAALVGRNIIIEGTVTLYRNTPQIDLESPSQLQLEPEIAEKPSAP